MNSRTAARSRSSASRSASAPSYFARSHDGLERFELFARPLDGVVGLGEVFEVADDVAHPLGGVGRLEHVVADEVVEVADRLHRDRLMEQFQRLLRSDAEQARTDVAYFGNSSKISAPPPGAACAGRAGPIRSRRSRSRSTDLCGGDEEPVGLTGALALLEDLGQGDGLVVASLVKTPRMTEYVRCSRSPMARDRPVVSFRSDL